MMAVAATGLIVGYALTVAQLTPGVGNRISKARDKWRNSWRNKAARKTGVVAETGGHVLTDALGIPLPPMKQRKFRDIESIGTLADCGWCASPYVTALVWPLTARLSHVHGVGKWLLGYAASTALGAFLRHEAERY